MKKILFFLMLLALVVSMTACGKIVEPNTSANGDTTETSGIENSGSGTETREPTEASAPENNAETEDTSSMKMNVQIGDTSFSATLEENSATHELIEMMKQAPVTVNMSDYSGFEKVGSLGRSLTTDNHQITTSAGDIVLYNGNQIVMFYGSNSWSYTRIGKIDDLSGWEDALGSGDITAVFSLAD